MAENNTWLSAAGHSQVDFFINASDQILIDRRRSIKLLLDIFSYHFNQSRKLRLLDVGCGNGIITKNIRQYYPQHEYHLLDGSGAMLDEARKLLDGIHCTFIQSTFEDFITQESDDQQYDFIFSSMALHHLDWHGKSGMYAKLFRLLNPGGLFLNNDVVLPVSERSEAWQFQMWRDWMNENLRNQGNETGLYDGLPDSYKQKAENKPSDLCRQLELLRTIGYRNADCFYKYGIFALFGGTKS